MQQDKAAIVIQTAWREHFQFFTTKHIVDNFINHGLTSDLAKSIQLDDLVTKLRNPDLVSASEFVLKRVHSISGSKIESKPNVFRVFLSGYMIAYHPSSIFESVGPLEQALLDASTPMIDSFERICGEVVLQRKALREIVAEFPRVFKKYLECFEGWKTPDENKMGLRIKHALLALYNAQTRLPPNEDDRLCQVIYCFFYFLQRLPNLHTNQRRKSTPKSHASVTSWSAFVVLRLLWSLICKGTLQTKTKQKKTVAKAASSEWYSLQASPTNNWHTSSCWTPSFNSRQTSAKTCSSSNKSAAIFNKRFGTASQTTCSSRQNHAILALIRL